MPAQSLDSSLLTNVSSIDREHFELVSLLDALINNHDAHPDTDAFSEIMGRLGGQLGTHFRNEEKILKLFAKPESELLSHSQAHTDILDQYVQMNLDLMEGKALSRDDALVAIKRWIITHLLDYDLQIRDYMPKT
jgi:hemerythrin-like metal-binding protein